jgi:hypothetical protein
MSKNKLIDVEPLPSYKVGFYFEGLLEKEVPEGTDVEALKEQLFLELRHAIEGIKESNSLNVVNFSLD